VRWLQYLATVLCAAAGIVAVANDNALGAFVWGGVMAVFFVASVRE
jgi:hypothetical protein